MLPCIQDAVSRYLTAPQTNCSEFVVKFKAKEFLDVSSSEPLLQVLCGFVIATPFLRSNVRNTSLAVFSNSNFKINSATSVQHSSWESRPSKRSSHLSNLSSSACSFSPVYAGNGGSRGYHSLSLGLKELSHSFHQAWVLHDGFRCQLWLSYMPPSGETASPKVVGAVNTIPGSGVINCSFLTCLCTCLRGSSA